MRNEKGQGVVEYILLLAVAVSLVMTFYRSAAYQRLFGRTGSIGTSIKNQTEFAYRHAYYDPAGVSTPPSPSISGHPSYEGNGQTRFFGPSDPYP